MPPEAAPAVRRPIFLFGFARSGTTLMRAILGQHSRITMFNEPELIFALLRAGFPVDRPTTAAERPGLVQRLRTQQWPAIKHLEDIPAQRLDEIATRPAPLGFAQVYEALLAAPAPAQDGIWGEKSLNNLFFVDRIAQLYPRAGFIYMRRDPRAVALSKFRKNRRFRGLQPTGKLGSIISHAPYFAIQARCWLQWDKQADLARSRHQTRWLDVAYEDFVVDPTGTVAGVCNFLGVPFETSMLASAARGDDPVLSSMSSHAHRALSQEVDGDRANAYLALPVCLSSMILAITGYDGSEQRVVSRYQDLLIKLILALRWRHISWQVQGHLDRRLVEAA